MDPKFQTSFIPKRPVVMSGSSVVGKRPVNFLELLAIIIFVLTILAIGGSYLFARYTTQRIENKKKELTDKREGLGIPLIKDLVILDSRLSSTKTLLDSHTASSKFFTFLQENTLQTVRFNNLKYLYSKQGAITIELSGQARSYATVAVQSDTFAKLGVFKNIVFSDLGLDEKGNVKFTMQAELASDAVKYVVNAPEVVVPTVSATTTSTTTNSR